MLELEGLTKTWPGFDLSLSLRLGDGEIAAVLGPSGCGKSTLLRLISGLCPPDAGRIFIDGREVTALPPERRGIGMVFQDFALFPHMSVRRNIEYGPRMRRIGRAQRRARAEALAASLEISALLDRNPYSLSGGEQQRVALARALAAEPAIVLLDEPLSSLDASLRRRLRSEIADRLREAGMSAILVTHDAEEALAVADRICLLRKGRLEAEGPPEALYDSPPTAWSASFLGRGPVLEILGLEGGGSSPRALTPLGSFSCGGRAPDREPEALALFFPAEAPLVLGTGGGPAAANRITGKVVSSSFAGRCRRIVLSCPVSVGPTRGGNAFLELELPACVHPAPGEALELEIPSNRCSILPIRSE